MPVGIEINVDVAHQLGKLRRHPILGHHLGADASDPKQLRLRAVAKEDFLDAGGPFHRPVFAIDRVDLR